MPTREQYVAQRVAARMRQRGETMTLRRISMGTKPVPYRNPPDVSADLVVLTGVAVNQQAYLGVSGSSVIGRLVAGDTVTTVRTGTTIVWTVQTMPTAIATDSDGIAAVGTGGIPELGPATPYSPDCLAAGDIWPCIPVTAAGNPDPAGAVGADVTLAYAADETVYGYALQFTEMIQLGWTEVDTLGIRIAAWNQGPITRPRVDDQLIVNGQLRAIMQLGPVFRRGVDLEYIVQAR